MSVFNPGSGDVPWNPLDDRMRRGGIFNPGGTASSDRGVAGETTPSVSGDTGGGTGKRPDPTLDFSKAFGMEKNPYSGTWQAPAAPSSFGSVSSGGTGGRGMVGDVGEFEYDAFEWDVPDFEYDPFEQEYSYEDFAPVDRFQAPVEAVEFREFQAPTQEEASVDPGYQFRLEEGRRALENAAAARGMLRTGNTWKDLLDYGQRAGTAEYDKVYGRRLGEHDLAYRQALQANQDRYGRALGEQQLAYQQGAQTYDINRQNALAAYDRDFQRHQANQMGALGAHQANFGIAAGIYDRGFAGQEARYGYGLQRAMQEAAMAETAASRAQSASAANVAARERAYNRQYQQAFDKYKLDYSNWEDDQTRRMKQHRWYTSLT